MALIDPILNLAAVLLWLRGRDKGHERFAAKVSLVVTLNKTEPRRQRIWFLIGLVALLLIRSILYWQLGSALSKILLETLSSYLELSLQSHFESFSATNPWADLGHATKPSPGQHLVRYYGAYSNRARGERRKRADNAPGKQHEEYFLPCWPRIQWPYPPASSNDPQLNFLSA